MRSQHGLDHKVRKALEIHLRSQEKKIPISAHDIAVSFFDAEAELVRAWTIARIQRIVGALIRAMAKPQKPQPFQMFLPGFRGDLTERVPVPVPAQPLAAEGKKIKTTRVPLGSATIGDLRRNLRLLKLAATHSPKIVLREQLIKDMQPYARENPDLTVGEYCKLKAAGVPPPPMPMKTARKSA